MANNYVFTNKKGEVFVRTSNAWSYVLKHYISDKVGYNSANFRLDLPGWTKIADSSNTLISNTAEIDMFNSLCTKSRLRIQSVYYGYRQLFLDSSQAILNISSAGVAQTANNAIDKSSTVTDTSIKYILFLTNNGRSYIYDRTNAALLDANKTQAGTIRELLLRGINKYVTDNLGYTRGLTIEKATWDLVTRGEGTNDPKLVDIPDIINTFNALCKRSKDRLALVAAFASGARNGPIFREQGSDNTAT